MISQQLIVQNMLQQKGLADKESQVYEARQKFSLHLGFELKIQLEQGDKVRFAEQNLLVLSREDNALLHAIPLQSVIYVSVP